jgi:uncharacterized membrane protein YphA (DoxX/SURF4 family)
MVERPRTSISEHFATLTDPRVERSRADLLVDIVTRALCGVICGADDWVAVATFGRAKAEWLGTCLELPGGIPSHDTFGRVFARLNPEEFRRCCLAWVRAVVGEPGEQVVAIREPEAQHISTGAMNGFSPSAVQPTGRQTLAPWRCRGLAGLRIVFGLVWLIDAYFKWLPGFHDNLDKYLEDGAEGQPAIVQAWVNLWINVIGVQPHFYSNVVAVGETAVAIALIVGVFSNLAYLGGVVLSLGIWSTAEGFGGPYQAGSVDIGAAIIYVLVFAGQFLTSAGLHFGLDRYLTPWLGRWDILASGPLKTAGKGSG